MPAWVEVEEKEGRKRTDDGGILLDIHIQLLRESKSSRGVRWTLTLDESLVCSRCCKGRGDE